MAQAEDDNIEQTTEIDDFDSIDEHVRKAMGIVACAPGAATSGVTLSEDAMKAALWAAFGELEFVRDAVDRLGERHMARIKTAGGAV